MPKEEAPTHLNILRACRDSVLPVYETERAERVEPDNIVVHREVSERVCLEPAFGESPGNFSVLAEGGVFGVTL